MARLILEHSSKVLKDYPFAKKSLTIGRHVDNTIVLDDPVVSGYHARIDKRGVDYILTDLQSTNGTFLNDVNIVSHRLSHGDRIIIGEHAILFVGTEMAKTCAEEKKLDLNKTTIRGVSKKRRPLSQPKTIERAEITATKVKRSRLLGGLAPVCLGIFILTVCGWYILNHEPGLLKSILSVAIRTEVSEGETSSAGRHLSKTQSNEVESIPLITKVPQRPIPQPFKEPSEPLLSEKDPFMPISTDDQEPSSNQSWDKSEGLGKTLSNEIDEPEFILEGIVLASKSNDSFAVINGRMVREGGSVAGGTITEIGKHYVIIQSPKDNSKIKFTLR
ncbi:FHA domain-containing protein [bacterium]|nr:FHA domain-containing protein [bacterium]